MEYQIVTTNRKAYHDYHILDKLEAGIELTGGEVKSLREGKANLKEAYIAVRNNEAFLIGSHFGPYSHLGYSDHKPTRDRRLLLKKREILKLGKQIAEKGLTVIPLKLYFKGGWIKVEIAVAKGKKQYDKKESLKKRDIQRQTDREINRR